MIEIERKFLVAILPDLTEATATTIQQGYLTQPDDSASVRLRQNGAICFLTVKTGEGLARTERETEIPPQQFAAFWPLTAGRRIQKTRWTGRLEGGHVFELDMFDPPLAPLRLVEVEFETVEAATAFEPPDWFGRDVTDDPAFGNKALAINGLPDNIAP